MVSHWSRRINPGSLSVICQTQPLTWWVCLFLLPRDVTHRKGKEASRGVQTELHGSIRPTVVVSLTGPTVLAQLVQSSAISRIDIHRYSRIRTEVKWKPERQKVWREIEERMTHKITYTKNYKDRESFIKREGNNCRKRKWYRHKCESNRKGI